MDGWMIAVVIHPKPLPQCDERLAEQSVLKRLLNHQFTELSAARKLVRINRGRNAPNVNARLNFSSFYGQLIAA
jgi:hypothetical protein